MNIGTWLDPSGACIIFCVLTFIIGTVPLRQRGQAPRAGPACDTRESATSITWQVVRRRDGDAAQSLDAAGQLSISNGQRQGEQGQENILPAPPSNWPSAGAYHGIGAQHLSSAAATKWLQRPRTNGRHTGRIVRKCRMYLFQLCGQLFA